MAYFYGTYSAETDLEGLKKKVDKENRKKHKDRIRRRHQTVYRPVKTFKGRALTDEELYEYMRNVKEFYAKKALREEKKRGNEFKLPESYDDNKLQESKEKFGNKKTRKIRGRPTTYTLKTVPELLKNRRKRGPSGKILTNKRDYRETLKRKNEKYFGGRKTRKRKRKLRRKTRRKKRRRKRKR
tara:strand:+ start:278 stop:829 length:552 start_codon:yes stop_codon:yes gene_type:complete